MCGARGPWPSSSCASCRSSGTNPQAQSLLPASICKRYAVQTRVPASCFGMYMTVQDGRKEESLAVFPPHSISHGLSYLEGTALHIVGGSLLKQVDTCVPLVTNFVTSPAMNLEKRADFDCNETEKRLKAKGQEKLPQRKPQLELRRPGPCMEEVVVPDVTKWHRVDPPAAGLHVRQKPQVGPQKSTRYKNHLSGKLPRLLTLPRESRPRFSKGGIFSKEVDEAVGELRRWRVRNGNFDEVIEKYGKKFSSRDISCILTELQRRHDWQCTLELFQWIKKQTWHRPNSRLYTQLIGFLGREGQVDRATLLFQEMLLQKCKPDQYTFTALLNAYGKARMFNEAIAVFNYMKECSDPECQPNTVTCNCLVDALVKGGLYDLAVKLFLDMQEGTSGLNHDSKPNVITYNVLIDALCKEGLVEVGVRVLQQMRQEDLDYQVLPNTATYNTIIDACGKGGFHERAEDLMEEMVEHELEPDQITYTALIDAYGKAGLWESAENTFKGMRGAHVNVDVMAYTAMIDAYAKEGLHEKAESLFKQMQQSGVRPNQITYLALIDAYGKSGLPDEAHGVLMAMQAAGYEGNVLIYSSLIDAYGKAGCYKEATGMLDRMRLTGCQPNLVTYGAILSSCSRCNTREEALVLLQSLQGSGNNIEDKICKLILDPDLNDKLWDDVTEMLKNIKSHAKATQYSFCNALIDVLWNCGLRGRAARVLSLARELGVYYDDFCIYTKTEWCLDLHRLSVGAAITMLLTWLDELHQAWVWGEDAPETVVVVAGKGKHSKSKISALKAPIDVQLSQLNSPFTDLEGNLGRSTASGSAVQDWLLSQGIKQQLRLIDAVQPWA